MAAWHRPDLDSLSRNPQGQCAPPERRSAAAGREGSATHVGVGIAGAGPHPTARGWRP